MPNVTRLHPAEVLCPLCRNPGLRGNRDGQSCPTCGYLRTAGSTTFRVRIANVMYETLIDATRRCQMSLVDYAGEVLECHAADLRCQRESARDASHGDGHRPELD